MFEYDEHKVSKRVQRNYLGKCREYWNSKIELQWVKPQAQDQSNKVQNNKHFKWSRGCCISLKVWLFLSFHTIHIKQNYKAINGTLDTPTIAGIRITLLERISTTWQKVSNITQKKKKKKKYSYYLSQLQ